MRARYVTLEQIEAAQKTVRVVSVQNLYNLVDRRDEDVVDFCTQEGIPFMPYFPLAVGNLRQGVGPLATIARNYLATPAQVALAWLRARLPQIVLIPGTGAVAHLEEDIASASLRLSKQELQQLAESAEVSAIHSYRA